MMSKEAIDTLLTIIGLVVGLVAFFKILIWFCNRYSRRKTEKRDAERRERIIENYWKNEK